MAAARPLRNNIYSPKLRLILYTAPAMLLGDGCAIIMFRSLALFAGNIVWHQGQNGCA